tara:strand:+ start:4221 stop:4661 length:441 start_codon:yes stop_codon:yes gene_type:complete
MPGPHFNSKRLKAAKNVRAEFAPGSVPRVGTRLFTLRLLPRTVESNCGCRIPKPKPPAFIVKAGRVQNTSQVIDPLDGFGATGTGWVQTSGIAVGDTVSFINPVNNQLFTTTVQSINHNENGKYMLILADPHGQVGGVNVDINLYI